MSEKKISDSTDADQNIFDFFENEFGKCFEMNSFRQWSHLNETNDGFYAETNKEVERNTEEPTQLMSSSENAELDNSMTGTNVRSSLFSSPEVALNRFNNANAKDCSSSSAPRPQLQKGKDLHDEYYEMHMRCMYGRGVKGIQILASNYRAVLHALSGCVVSGEVSQVDNAQKYLACFNCALNNLKDNARVLLGNRYGIFNKLPNYVIPPQVMALLQITYDNYSITKKINTKAKNAKPTLNIQSNNDITEDDDDDENSIAMEDMILFGTQ
jgi:hypothetical protein